MKRERTRFPAGAKKEPAYPIYALDEAMKVAKAVSDLGGSRAPVSKSILAKHLAYAETGPSFFQRVAAAKSFGLIEGWGAYVLTESGRRYFYPTTDTDRNSALVTFLGAPKSFRQLVQRFDGGKLPNAENIGNLLHNEGTVPGSWKDRVAAIFLRSAQFAGVIDANGFLRCKAALHGGGVGGEVVRVEEDTEPPEERLSSILKNSPATKGVSVWVHKGIRLETPETLDTESWQALKSYVEGVIKPKEASKND